MKVRDILNINFIRIQSGVTMAEAAEMAAMSNAGELCVVDDENNFIGVLAEGDMMVKAIPDITEVMASSGGIRDSNAIFSEKAKTLGQERIDDHLVKEVITLGPDDNVLKAATTMSMKKMRCLPVVKNGKLMGTISRGDICKAIFTG